MSDLERVAVVLALVGAFRARNAAGHSYAPFLEGNVVTLVAAFVGAALCTMSHDHSNHELEPLESYTIQSIVPTNKPRS